MGYEVAANPHKVDVVPAHVPPELVVDFNHIHPEGVEDDPHMAFKKLHDGPDIVWTPHNGGHWIVTRADDINAVLHDTATFSSRQFVVPRPGPGNPSLIPNQVDPPEHAAKKSIPLRPLAPKAIAPIEPLIREVMAKRIALLAPKGGCEFVSEFTNIPPELFLHFAKCPIDDVDRVKRLTDITAGSEDDNERREARLEGIAWVQKVLEQRRQCPGDGDLFTVIVEAEQKGLLTPDESNRMALNIFFGGLETVASSITHIVRFLAESPEHRRQLIENPDLSRDATEELLRRFGILNIARVTTRRTVFKGVTFEEDEMVMLPLHLANLDERKFADPFKVDFHRSQNAHFNFGTGIHRCLGSNLARPEVRIFIEEWLKAFPDFSIAPGKKPIGSSGTALGYKYMPLAWPTPSAAAA